MLCIDRVVNPKGLAKRAESDFSGESRGFPCRAIHLLTVGTQDFIKIKAESLANNNNEPNQKPNNKKIRPLELKAQELDYIEEQSQLPLEFFWFNK